MIYDATPSPPSVNIGPRVHYWSWGAITSDGQSVDVAKVTACAAASGSDPTMFDLEGAAAIPANLALVARTFAARNLSCPFGFFDTPFGDAAPNLLYAGQGAAHSVDMVGGWLEVVPAGRDGRDMPVQVQSMTTTTELHLAYVWDCDTCGRENFERAIVYEPSPEDREDAKDAGEEFASGHWMTRPENVECKHCGAKFEAKDDNEE